MTKYKKKKKINPFPSPQSLSVFEYLLIVAYICL